MYFIKSILYDQRDMGYNRKHINEKPDGGKEYGKD
jgi:hypothetical protein